MNAGDHAQLLSGCPVRGVRLGDRREHHVPAVQEQRVEDLLLGGEVVVDEAVGDSGLVRDVRHAAGVEALPREHADGGVEDHPALVDRSGRPSAATPVARVADGEATAGGDGCPRSWSKSSSATIAVSASGAPASTTPHGSTISERPPDAVAGAVGRRSGWPRPRSTGSRSRAPAAAPPSDRGLSRA